jgi:demethyllactenocin mycarosyltransferase
LSHITFVVAPAAGHVNPTLAVVAELVRRGHRVTYAVTAEYAERVAAAGADCLHYATTMADFDRTVAASADARRFSTDSLATVLSGLLHETIAMLPVLDREFRAERPDLVVHDATYGWAGAVLAARWGVPALRSQPMFATNASFSLSPRYAEFDPAHPGVAAVAARLGVLLTRTGATGLRPADLFAADDSRPAIVFLPRSFQYAGDTFSPHTRFVGPCLRSGGYRPATPVGRSGRPYVVVTLGSVYHDRPHVYRACLEALTMLGWHGAVAVGNQVDPRSLPAAPAGVTVHPVIPDLIAELSRAAVLVNHASMASSMEALALGVPVIGIPQIAEHRANADRIAELGLGAHVAPAAVTARTLAQALGTAVHDPAVGSRVAAMRAEIHASGGATAAADVVEGLLTPAVAGRPATG